MKELLKEIIRKLPKKPGVYIFKNSGGKIIYIGKALSLRDRVSNYFKQKHSDQKTIELVSQINDLQIIEVSSEFEALLLEAKLIKQHRPKYNIQSKDDKSYLYIIISRDYPNRIYTGRRPELEEKILAWFGPFPSSRDAKEILKTIRRVFPFRSCTNLPSAPCLYYHLKLCTGVCLNKENHCHSRSNRESTNIDSSIRWNDIENNYNNTIRQVRQLLSGKTIGLIKSLEKEMKMLSKQNEFEKANEIKYKISALSRLAQGWKNVPQEKQEASKTIEEIKKILIKYGGINQLTINKIEGYDISNLGNQIIVGSMVAFTNGEPDKSLYRKFNLKYNLSCQDDPEGIRQIVRRRLNHPEWILPQIILVDGGKTQVTAAFQALKEKNFETQIAAVGLIKGEEILIIPKIKFRSIVSWKRLRLLRNSSVLQLLQRLRDESHRFAQKYYRQNHSKKFIT